MSFTALLLTVYKRYGVLLHPGALESGQFETGGMVLSVNSEGLGVFPCFIPLPNVMEV